MELRSDTAELVDANDRGFRASRWPRPDAKPMEMSGPPMEGYVFIDPPPRANFTRLARARCCLREHLAAKGSAVDVPADQDRHADQRAVVNVGGARPGTRSHRIVTADLNRYFSDRSSGTPDRFASTRGADPVGVTSG